MAKPGLPPGAPSYLTGKNPAAVKAAKALAATGIRDLSAGTIKGLQSAIAKAIRTGMAPADAARMIVGVLGSDGFRKGGLVGLNSRQSAAAMTYRSSLIEAGKSPAQVERLFGKYTDKLRKVRARALARTEIIKALEGGKSETWAAARRAGLIPKNVVEIWLISGGACKICTPLDGTTIDEGGWPVDKPPAHTNCRCSRGLEER